MATIEQLSEEVAALRRRVEASESNLQIQELKARYGDLVDQRFFKGAVVDEVSLDRIAREVASLFIPEGVWDGGAGLGEARGREAIVDRLKQPTLSFSRHLFLRPRIRVSGEQAWARWDLLCPCNRPDGSSYWMCGYEDDEYVRVEGFWLHRTMRLTTVFMSPAGGGWPKILA